MAHRWKDNTLVSLLIAVALALSLCVTLGLKPAEALENLRVFRGYLILEGKVEPGDYTSLRNFLRDESNFDKISGGVFVASPGGYVAEAIKIGNLIRQLRLSTNAPAIPPPERRDVRGPPILATDLAYARH